MERVATFEAGSTREGPLGGRLGLSAPREWWTPPALLKAYVAFYSPLVRKGLVEHRTKELVRLRLAALNGCHY